METAQKAATGKGGDQGPRLLKKAATGKGVDQNRGLLKKAATGKGVDQDRRLLKKKADGKGGGRIGSRYRNWTPPGAEDIIQKQRQAHTVIYAPVVWV